jgi:hypothetical protein
VTVDFQGRTLTLALHVAKGAAALQPTGRAVALDPHFFDERHRRVAQTYEDARRREVLEANRQAASQLIQPPVPFTSSGTS